MRYWNVRYPDEKASVAPRVVTILDAPEQSFRFFDLPAELRDRVYDYLTIDLTFELSEREQYTTGLSKTYLENGLRSEVLLSNRRLAREYRDQVAAQSTLVFEDQFALQYALETPRLWNPNIRNCRIHLSKSCICPRRYNGQCRGALPPSEVELLMSMPKTILSVDLELVHFAINQAARYEDDLWPKSVHGESYVHSLHQMVTLPNIKRVEIYTFQSRQDHMEMMRNHPTPTPLGTILDWKRCDQWAKHTATWTKADGWSSGTTGTGPRFAQKDGFLSDHWIFQTTH